MNSQKPRYEIRGATQADEDALLKLAAHLNTVNLPNDRQSVRDLLSHAEHSFDGSITAAKRKYVFLLWDLTQGTAIGSSSIIAQLGRRDAPYIYFDVIDEERYSKSLDKHFHHTVLRLGFSYKGPTELGGLVVAPSERGSPERLGRFVSYARFAYIAGRREVFRDQLLAELLPPLEPDGTSHLWEALGRRFTGMTYAEADLLSSRDKEFIRDLFPLGEIHTSLFDDRARDVIGRVGEQTLGVERMLVAAGFRYARRVDPFDGGPHFVAKTEEVTLVQNARRVRFRGVLPAEAGRPAQEEKATSEKTAVGPAAGRTPPGKAEPARAVVLQYLPRPPYVISVQSEFAWSDTDAVLLPAAVAEHLGLAPDAELMVTPLPAAAPRAKAAALAEG